MLRSLTPLLLALLSVRPASAQPIAANFAAAGLVPLSMPLDDLAAKRWNLSISPAYFKSRTFNTEGNVDDYKDVHGLGWAGSVVYGFSDHWGVGFTGLGFSGSGKYHVPAGSFVSDPVGDHDTKTSGFFSGATLVWDHFEGDGFRLPVLFGLGFVSVRDESKALALKQTIVSPGIVFGASPRFNTGPFRWEPYMMAYIPANNEKVFRNGVLVDQSIHSDTGGPALGINAVYRPFNLSFFYSLGVSKAKGTHIYSLRWKKQFGGG